MPPRPLFTGVLLHTYATLFAGLFASITQAGEPIDLPRALTRAEQNRPAVQAARLRVEGARHTRRSLAAPPSTRLDVGASTQSELRGNDDDLVLAQPLDLFGRRRANRALGEAQVLLAEAELRRTLTDVQGEVVERYAEAVAASELAANATAALEVTERLRELTRLRVEGRIAPAVQLTRVGIEVERERQNVVLRRAQREAALRRLGGVVGTPVDAVADYGVISTLRVNPGELAASRGDLLTLAANLRIAEANARVARASGRPELEVSARTNVWTPGDKVSGLRLQLSLPIFDYGRVRSETRAAETQVEAERRSLADAVLRAQAELEAVQVEVNAASEGIASFESLIASARELVQKSEIGLREGAAGMTLLDVLEATRSLREVEQGWVEARLRLAQAQATYLRASGRLIAADGEGHDETRTSALSLRGQSRLDKALRGIPGGGHPGPKGRDDMAQGNARSDVELKNGALKGRDNLVLRRRVVSPLQGLGGGIASVPGRCPGLYRLGPSGLGEGGHSGDAGPYLNGYAPGGRGERGIVINLGRGMPPHAPCGGSILRPEAQRALPLEPTNDVKASTRSLWRHRPFLRLTAMGVRGPEEGVFEFNASPSTFSGAGEAPAGLMRAGRPRSVGVPLSFGYPLPRPPHACPSTARGEGAASTSVVALEASTDREVRS
ncbi:MAG: TolC family protein [Fimbriimonas sp.]